MKKKKKKRKKKKTNKQQTKPTMRLGRSNIIKYSNDPFAYNYLKCIFYIISST